MFKSINMLLVALCLSIIATAQVNTNYNNTQRLTARGQFLKNYSVKPYPITAPDITNALLRDQREKFT